MAVNIPENNTTFQWLINLRWWTVTGQIVISVITFYAIGDAIPVPSVLIIILVQIATTLALFTYISVRIKTSCTGGQESLDLLKCERLKNERLSALVTLTAGATHELATPLSTISVAAGEIVFECANSSQISTELSEDAHLIKDQVHRCKDILSQIAVDAGTTQGEPLSILAINALISRTLEILPDASKIKIINKTTELFSLPVRSVCRTIKDILQNALDATGQDKQILLTCFTTKTHLCFSIKDNGEGMSEEVQKQAFDPFFTTKLPEKGMGLGLFIAKSICNRFDGSLSFASNASKNTIVTITFALAKVAL